MMLALMLPAFSNILSQPVINNRDPFISEMVNEISAENLEYTVRALVSFKTRHSLSKQNSETEGIGAAASWIKSQFDKYAIESGGRLVPEIDSFIIEADGKRVTRNTNFMNVMATLKGADANDNRVFIIGGHYDSRVEDIMDSTSQAPGANDDASGVAVTMELARIMSKREFPATIIFVAFTGEEQGLFGATHLAKKAKDNNWNVSAMLNNDMVGNSFSGGTLLKDNTQVRVFSENIPANETEQMVRTRQYSGSEYDGISRQLARYCKEIGERYADKIKVKLIFRNDRFLRGGDHTPFARAGYAAVRFCEMNENYDYQHQNVRTENGIAYGDLPENVDYEYSRKIASLNLAVLANLNLAPAAPSKVSVDISDLTNSTRLFWSAPNGKTPAGYYVMMRETYQPFWESKLFVKESDVTVPYSKDNYFFAVQAVDGKGHESLPVFPVPARGRK